MQHNTRNIRLTSNQSNPVLANQIQDCTQDCLNSHVTCMDTAMSVMQQGGKPDMVRLLLDCAEICQTSAHFMIRDSEVQGYANQACAEISTRCAECCMQEGLTDCGNACRATANSTQQIIKMMAN